MFGVIFHPVSGGHCNSILSPVTLIEPDKRDRSVEENSFTFSLSS